MSYDQDVHQLTDFRSWLKGFSKLLKIPVVAGEILIPPALGDGYVLAANINTDISYVVMDFSLKDDLVLLRKKSALYGLSLFQPDNRQRFLRDP